MLRHWVEEERQAVTVTDQYQPGKSEREPNKITRDSVRTFSNELVLITIIINATVSWKMASL